MRFSLLAFASVALAARPFLNEPDTGLDEAHGDIPTGSLLPLENVVGLPDFEWAARRKMNASGYTYYRNGAGGEWSYRNNLEVFQRFRLRPRVLNPITQIESTLPTTILGHNFSAPFFIAPCARAGFAHPDAELNFVKAAAAKNILYIPSILATKSIPEIAAAKAPGQVLFQQVYITANETETKLLFGAIEQVGAKAIVLTVDSATDGIRHRAQRYGVESSYATYSTLTWDAYRKLSAMTTLPIVPKGIQTVEDARLAIQNGAKAIYLSNHGGRQLDTSPSPLEIALEIYEEDPEVFQEVEVYADGGVRYGSDALKLLALGVRAVGIGRPFMFSNVYGTEGVEKAVDLMKREVSADAANLGVADLKKIGPQFVNWKSLNVWSG